jgi:hypothetical protein
MSRVGLGRMTMKAVYAKPVLVKCAVLSQVTAGGPGSPALNSNGGGGG